jgi:hypothetical protein
MTVVKRIVPSQAASGVQTFSDSLVGNQITNGTSQLTNTNFALDKTIPEKDSKNFKTAPFSEFLTLDTLKEETDAPTTQDSLTGTPTKKEKIRFRGVRDNANKSLFGSLKERLQVSINKIILKYPAGILIDGNSPINVYDYTAQDIVYDKVSKTTDFYVHESLIYNPYDIVITKPNSDTIPDSNNTLRNFYSSYTKYVVDYSGSTYEIISYNESDENGLVRLKVKGNLFSGYTGVTDSFIFRPNNGITEEFYNNLDDLEELLLNRETNPKYNATFKVPRDSFDGASTDLVDITVNWPISRDGWNLQIVGIDYDDYLYRLSAIADEIDDYKSNLIVRFLTAPQLFEFDTEERKAQSVFQLYGQSFDKVKKYIDNIAYMRNVSYDGIMNVPDMLLKNLSETLGLSTLNLFDEKTLDSTLYTRQNTTFSGLSVGKTLVEAEYEFYRRMLVNLAHIYKSKGTRSSIEFFLKFIGAPEPMIKIDEFVYDVVQTPQNLTSIENDIKDLIQGEKINTVITGYTQSTNTYLTGITTGTTTLVRDEYPINESGLPRKVTNLTNDIFFQKGSGWYDLTLDHRSSDITDTENSVLTGRVKTIKTKNKDYTYGEEYFDNFRTLSGLDYGFTLEPRIDNLKISSTTDDTESSLVLNRKNLSIYLTTSQAVDYDIYRQSRNLDLTFGTLEPQTNLTFAEFLGDVLNQVVVNSNVIKYRKNYIYLDEVYNQYMTNVEGTETDYVPYDYSSLNDFVNKMSPYWVQMVEQLVPSTTLWTGGNLIESTTVVRSKYQYVKPTYNMSLTYEPQATQPPQPTATPTMTPTPTVTPTPTSTPTPTPTIDCNFDIDVQTFTP